MEARVAKHKEEENAPKEPGVGFLPILSIASLVFSSEKESASEKTLSYFQNMQMVIPPEKTGEKGKIETVDMVEKWKERDDRHEQKKPQQQQKEPQGDADVEMRLKR